MYSSECQAKQNCTCVLKETYLCYIRDLNASILCNYVNIFQIFKAASMLQVAVLHLRLDCIYTRSPSFYFFYAMYFEPV